MRKMKSAIGQLKLPYSRGQKFRLLRSALFDLPGKTQRAFKSAYQLIEQLELCTFADGCRVRQEVLAARMRCSVGTVARAIRLAVELKILTVENDHANGGGMNRYKIDWHAINIACPMNQRKEASEEADETETVETVEKVPAANDKGETEKTSPAEWKSVEVALRDCRVKGWAKAVAVARERGLTPGDCHDLISFATSRPVGFWKDRPTAIYVRLTTAQQGESSVEGWLPASGSFLQRERVARERVVRAEEKKTVAADLQQKSFARAKRDELEKQFGPCLDRMTRADLREFAEMVFAGNSFMLSSFSRNPSARLVREKLLVALSEQMVTK